MSNSHLSEAQKAFMQVTGLSEEAARAAAGEEWWQRMGSNDMYVSHGTTDEDTARIMRKSRRMILNTIIFVVAISVMILYLFWYFFLR